MLDILITNARIVDGTGNAWFFGSVGVEDGRIRIIRGDVAEITAPHKIDAHNKIVCPGFIDMHAHSGLVALNSPKHETKVRQGITTELIGVDGNSYAPFGSTDDFDSFVLLNAGLDGRPPEGQRWSSVAEYLSLFDRKVSCNFAYVIGNSALRIATVGWEDRPATIDDIHNMRKLIRQGMEEGAFGISTGLTYPPGSYADTAELIEVSREVAEQHGIYVTHVRYSIGDRFMDPFKEAIQIGRRSGVPVHISHLHSPRPGAARKLLPLIDNARAEGIDVTFDSYAYPYTSTRLVSVLPEWAHSGGPHALLALMRSKDGREQMAESIAVRSRSWGSILITNFGALGNKRWEGLSVASIAETQNKDVIDTICDLLLEENLDLAYISLGGNPVNIREFFSHEAHMVGSDALLIGDFINPRTYGNYPMVLGDFVREEATLGLEQAIRKMTGFPAQRLGLHDRGILRDGTVADIVIFNPATVQTSATIDDPKQYPIGIDYVFVNGVAVIDNGEHTGATPGVALRHQCL
jgi:N-acyl-D-amino-acid deacylase